ncbi:P-loop containing nucleoside triphosphate hydrolase protein [Cercophora newfieldiana]|uniref:P-loop containing nucleoside triphosphate hydrolase protein n=1 Tax=Cercophora newfieldiana TaxID=92897 RepID=A0AA39Y5Y3_9PEZI|nr:P-loop containing nucleoside triphosphate hydrolase protein [Cercophora newfieldiana]
MPSAAPAKANKARTRKPVDEVVDESHSGSALDSATDSPGDQAGKGEDDDDEQSGSESGSGSESDSVDSHGPRKRRRVSLETAEEIRPIKSAINVPSRIRRAQEQNPKTTQPEAKAQVPDPAPGVTAPLHADTTFESLGVRPWLVQALANMAIKRPTGIQKATIPEILKGRDCIGGSRTGSGKTVAFAVPILQKWAEDPSAIYGVILTPTRELALQIYEQIKAISSPQSLKAILITGGADMRPQAIALAQRPHLVIATPGRLADHIRTSGEDTTCGLRRVRFVVLDEADRLLAAGTSGSMLPDVEECLSVLPPPSARQTLLFTATITPEVRALKDMPRQPGRLPVFSAEVDTSVLAIPSTLHQAHLQIPVTHREHYLHTLLLTPANVTKSIIIFCNRTSTADFLHHLLRLLDHRVTALHSRLPQRQRIDNLGRFRASAARILVATDVAARGLDIPEVKVVINYDIPRDPDDYIHRVGRTARAGRKGEAVTFVGQRDVDLVLAIEKRVGRKMEAWEEEGVNLESRVLRDALKVVSEKKREALLEVEEGKEVGGKRKKGKVKLKAL